MDAQVYDAFSHYGEDEPEAQALGFLLDEGLILLASYSKISDVGVRRALAGLIDALAKVEPLTFKEAS